MIRNGYQYVQTNILMDKFLADTGNRYRFVGQRACKGKPEAGLAAGTTVTLQILEDSSEPIANKKTEIEADNNLYETFDATIIGLAYPAPFKKGDIVRLDGFMAEASYFLDFSFILRFSKIEKVAPQNAKKEN